MIGVFGSRRGRVGAGDVSREEAHHVVDAVLCDGAEVWREIGVACGWAGDDFVGGEVLDGGVLGEDFGGDAQD